ncbi:MAG: T9SS type A sorting domain-containing protein [Ignavibacteriae bacterium]|nr:T9SS type A sorting domain-containing protein [Ignavibacteriota bacterium]
MKRIICCLIAAGMFTIAANNSNAQEIKIDRFVIGTGGMVAGVNDDNISMSGITGQIAIEKIAGTEPVYNNMKVDIYQGFWVPVGDFFSGVEETTDSRYGKIENFPNPFSSSTLVKYNLPSSGYVSLKIYDMVGNVIKTLYDGYQNMGDQELSWNGKDEMGSNLSSGSYLYELKYSPTTNGTSYTLRNLMVILR